MVPHNGLCGLSRVSSGPGEGIWPRSGEYMSHHIKYEA